MYLRTGSADVSGGIFLSITNTHMNEGILYLHECTTALYNSYCERYVKYTVSFTSCELIY